GLFRIKVAQRGYRFSSRILCDQHSQFLHRVTPQVCGRSCFVQSASTTELGSSRRADRLWTAGAATGGERVLGYGKPEGFFYVRAACSTVKIRSVRVAE